MTNNAEMIIKVLVFHRGTVQWWDSGEEIFTYTI